MSEGNRDAEEIADRDPGDLTDRELVIAIAAYAGQKGEAEARRDHIEACADRRRSGLLPALRNVVRVTHSRVSLRYVEGMETTVNKTVEERDDEFQEYLAEATARFDDALAPADDRGFW